MSNSDINPKDFPFNYIVHEGNAKMSFNTYGDAIRYCKDTYPKHEIDEHWSTNEDSRVYQLPGLNGDGPVKVVWSPEALREFECPGRIWDEDTWPDGRDLIDEACGIASGQIFIERRRDAYEEACILSQAVADLDRWERMAPAISDDAEDAEDADEWCPSCGGGTLSCYDCNCIWDSEL